MLNLLKSGIKNAIAVEGTNVPKTIMDLSKERVITAFVPMATGPESSSCVSCSRWPRWTTSPALRARPRGRRAHPEADHEVACEQDPRRTVHRDVQTWTSARATARQGEELEAQRQQGRKLERFEKAEKADREKEKEEEPARAEREPRQEPPRARGSPAKRGSRGRNPARKGRNAATVSPARKGRNAASARAPPREGAEGAAPEREPRADRQERPPVGEKELEERKARFPLGSVSGAQENSRA